MLTIMHPMRSRITYSLKGSSGRDLEDHLILYAHFTDEETEAHREEVIGGWVKSGIKKLA